MDNDSVGRCDVLFQNEYLLALRDDWPLCMTPDLIILLDEETGLLILGERLCYGMRVVARGVSAHEYGAHRGNQGMWIALFSLLK